MSAIKCKRKHQLFMQKLAISDQVDRAIKFAAYFEMLTAFCLTADAQSTSSST